MREPMIPLSAVMAIIERQEAFNDQLVDKLGLYLKISAEAYRDALNPPLEPVSSVPMSLNPYNDEAEDLYHQIETGIIAPENVTSTMKRILEDADMSIDIK